MKEVIKVEVLSDYRLLLTFDDNVKKNKRYETLPRNWSFSKIER